MFSKKHWLTSLLLVSVLTLTGAGCGWFGGEAPIDVKRVNLEYWRIADQPDSLSPLIEEYRVAHPNVFINVKVYQPEQFEYALLRAWASNQGPDIVSLPVSWLRAFEQNLSALPAKLEVPYFTIEGFKKESVAHMGVTQTPTIRELGQLFIDTVKDDVVINNKIYALPLATDTMVMYYNRDLLNKANLPDPAQDWNEFKDHVTALTLQDKQGNFLQHGTSLGGSDNMPLAFEILSNLMMQNGTPMLSGDNRKALFNAPITGSGSQYIPGEDALRFYTDFADPTKEVYTWTGKETSPLDLFISGRMAYYFGYSQDYFTIKKRAPRLNFSVANFPQLGVNSQPVYYADYFVEAVAGKSTSKAEAWDFILQATTKTTTNDKYLNKTNRLPVLRAQVSNYFIDHDLSVATKQLLNSKTWYHGYNIAGAKQAFLSMIRSAHAGALLQDVLSLGAKQVTLTLSPPVN